MKRKLMALLLVVFLMPGVVLAKEPSATGGDFAAAQGSLDRLDALVQAGTHSSFSERCPETLAIWAALRRPENREVVQNILFRIVDRQLRRNVNSGVPAWEVWSEKTESKLQDSVPNAR